jgi:hypothetical protein
MIDDPNFQNTNIWLLARQIKANIAEVKQVSFGPIVNPNLISELGANTYYFNVLVDKLPGDTNEQLPYHRKFQTYVTEGMWNNPTYTPELYPTIPPAGIPHLLDGHGMIIERFKTTIQNYKNNPSANTYTSS